MPLGRKEDGERLAVVETRQDAFDHIVVEIRKDIKGILRNQWIQCGVIALVLFLIEHPQLVSLLAGSSALASGVK